VEDEQAAVVVEVAGEVEGDGEPEACSLDLTPFA
jgi:hypothetical protein